MTDLEYHQAVAAMAPTCGALDLLAEATARARAARAASAQHELRMGLGVFTLDGVPIPRRAGSRGMAIAWLVLACHQSRTPMPDASALFPGKHAARLAYEAVRRAACDVDQVNLNAGAALRQIVRRGGCLTLLRPVALRCSMSSDMLEALARFVHD